MAGRVHTFTVVIPKLPRIARGDAFLAAFGRICRVILPRLSWAVLFAGALEAQSALTFQNTQMSVDSQILQVLTGDFNGDGNADVVLRRLLFDSCS
jgi:hypothetical protein